MDKGEGRALDNEPIELGETGIEGSILRRTGEFANLTIFTDYIPNPGTRDS